MLESQAGAFHTRDAGTIWDIPNSEAKRMIKAGICRKSDDATDTEAAHKEKLNSVNEELGKVYAELNQAIEEIESYERKVKSLSDEIKKIKKTGGKKSHSKKGTAREKAS